MFRVKLDEVTSKREQSSKWRGKDKFRLDGMSFIDNRKNNNNNDSGKKLPLQL